MSIMKQSIFQKIMIIFTQKGFMRLTLGLSEQMLDQQSFTGSLPTALPRQREWQAIFVER
jgi:hypothetical protein